jgi:hypothetical protein
LGSHIRQTGLTGNETKVGYLGRGGIDGLGTRWRINDHHIKPFLLYHRDGTGNLFSFDFKKRRRLVITALPPLGGCGLGVRIEYHHLPSSLLGYDSKTRGQSCLPTSAFLRY